MHSNVFRSMLKKDIRLLIRLVMYLKYLCDCMSKISKLKMGHFNLKDITHSNIVTFTLVFMCAVTDMTTGGHCKHTKYQISTHRRNSHGFCPV